MSSIDVIAKPQPGRLSGRFLKSLLMAGNNTLLAQEIIDDSNWADKHRIKTAVAGLTSSNFTNALAPINADFVEYFRPMTLLGRVQGMREVNFQQPSLVQTADGAAQWVGEAGAVSLAGQTFSNPAGLPRLKVGRISVVSREAHNNKTETFVLRDLAAACQQALDAAFVDPENAGVAELTPASVTNGGTLVASAGTDAAAIRTDLEGLAENYVGDLQSAFITMHPLTALQISLIQESLGDTVLNVFGGRLFGIPVYCSSAVPFTTDGSSISMLDANAIEFALDAEELSVAMEATIQMDSAPSNDSATPTATQLVSLWQVNGAALKALVFANWRLLRATSSVTITGVNYAVGA